jgi:hypothetical protein
VANTKKKVHKSAGTKFVEAREKKSKKAAGTKNTHKDDDDDARGLQEYKGNTFNDDIGPILHVMDAGRDVLVTRINTFKGRKSLDVRKFWDTGKNECAPGKGVSVPADDVATFLKMLHAKTGIILKQLGVTSTDDDE